MYQLLRSLLSDGWVLSMRIYHDELRWILENEDRSLRTSISYPLDDFARSPIPDTHLEFVLSLLLREKQKARILAADEDASSPS